MVYGAAQSTDPPPARINAPSFSEVTESAGADAVRSPLPQRGELPSAPAWRVLGGDP